MIVIRIITFLLIIPIVGACASRKPFWSYLVDKGTSKPEVRDAGEKDKPRSLSPYNVKVVYNDGSTSTEVLIPVLTSGQQIVIDHNRKKSPQALSVVPIPPTAADQTVEESYIKSGQPIRKKAPPVSIIKTHEKIRAEVKRGNYEVALQYAETILRRYPNHVKTLRTKGSLLLKLGERNAAYQTYIKAQEIEPDRRVEKIIRDMEKNLN